MKKVMALRYTVIFGLASAMVASLSLGQSNLSPLVFSAGVAVTGPSAALGDSEFKTLTMLEKTINAAGGVAGRQIKVNVYDTGSDPQKAVLAVRKGILEDKALGIICCTSTPESAAIADSGARAKVPFFAMAPLNIDGLNRTGKLWAFRTTPPDRAFVKATLEDMKKRGVKRMAFLGFGDAYGDPALAEFQKQASKYDVEIVEAQKFARADTDTSAQAAKITASKPDVVQIWATTPGAVTAHKSLLAAGYKGPIWHSGGVTNPSFLALGAKDVENVEIRGLALAVADQLPASAPNKEVISEFVKNYRAEYNNASPTTFGGHAYDALQLLIAASKAALAKGANPDKLEEFRVALRDALEEIRNFKGTTGVYYLSKADHNGLGQSSVVRIQVVGGKYTLKK
jgi:branched-chain amino acid transport system substrate-binding protein